MNLNAIRFSLLLTPALLCGCVTTTVEEFMTVAPIVGDGEAVVVLTNRQDAVVEAEKSFTECLYSRLQPLKKDIVLIDEEQFKDALFPWFEPRLAPSRPEAVSLLLEDPRIAGKTEELGVRYLIWIHGESAVVNKQGNMTCSFSAAGGGCFGVLSWDNNSDYEATIWDLQESRSLGVISSEATGTSVVTAIVVPIPVLARTKSASCKSLGDQLRNVLSSS